ncbi:hypothetical protein Dform_01265 [Dehalogenimonas formicexedens]|uniref:PH domain-containing protein n=1 Tax=Dehalogenimonas formicexedens TaxID=1839801 RepID=A0A1P8F834_9CHLR|nr:hypothetical protein [Dehalogenimonas formicexedens]APV44593.1 hypothetical protein Dform_01265 [Dehalogenimonas formicexedens]
MAVETDTENGVYREEIPVPAMVWLAIGLVTGAGVLTVLAFINPFASSGSDLAGGLFIPAALFLILAAFAASFGRFKIFATNRRFTISAGMNAQSVSWRDIESAAEDLSPHPAGNPLTATLGEIAGQPGIIYAIGALRRIELVLKSEKLRYLVFPTRHSDILLGLIRKMSREARQTEASKSELSSFLTDDDSGDCGQPDGIGGPPPFPIPL